MMLKAHEVCLCEILCELLCRSAEAIKNRDEQHDREVSVDELQRRRIGTILSEDDDNRK